jgi:REP element-mobilizing transposase RayT
MQTYESLKHTTSECKYHVVFIPKCRRKVLYQGSRQELGTVFGSLAEQWECRVEEGHLMPNHVHMLLSVPPKYSVSNVMGVRQREKRDPYCAGVCKTTQEFCQPAFLGTGLLGLNGRQERGGRA